MKSFIRENMLITAGIALPLVVVILFASASMLPHLYTAPPAHDLLLSVRYYNVAAEAPVKLRLSVRNGRLKASIGHVAAHESATIPKLFRYSQAAGAVQELDIPIPDNVEELAPGSELPVPELAGLTVSGALVAPDGYEFRLGGRGGGLMTNLFGGRSMRQPVISKDGVAIRINVPSSENYWNGRVVFLGWIVNERVGTGDKK